MKCISSIVNKLIQRPALALGFTILFVSLPNSALAVYVEGFERPQYQVSLDITNARGEFARIETYGLTFFRIDGSAVAGFTLRTDDLKYFARLFVRYKEDLGCGSVRYFAAEKAKRNGENELAVEPALRIAVIDHSNRFCDDGRTGIEARLYTGPEYLDENLGENADSALSGIGKPQGVITIM